MNLVTLSLTMSSISGISTNDTLYSMPNITVPSWSEVGEAINDEAVETYEGIQEAGMGYGQLIGNATENAKRGFLETIRDGLESATDSINEALDEDGSQTESDLTPE